MKKSTAILLVLITGGFWGFSFVSMNYLMGKLDPMQVLAGRWTLAAVVFLAMAAVGVIRIDLRKESVKYLILGALMQPCVYSVLEIYGIKYTSVSVSSILLAVVPSMSLLIGMVFYRRRPPLIGIVGILTAFAGIVIANVFAPDASAEGSVKGYIILIAGVTLLGFYGYVTSKAADGYGAMERTAVMAFFGAITFNIVCLARGFGAGTYSVIFGDLNAFLAIAFLGVVCSVICYSSYNALLSGMEPATASNLIACITTFAGVVTGILIAGDSYGWYTWVGLVVTLIGVVLSSRSIE